MKNNLKRKRFENDDDRESKKLSRIGKKQSNSDAKQIKNYNNDSVSTEINSERTKDDSKDWKNGFSFYKKPTEKKKSIPETREISYEKFTKYRTKDGKNRINFKPYESKNDVKEQSIESKKIIPLPDESKENDYKPLKKRNSQSKEERMAKKNAVSEQINVSKSIISEAHEVIKENLKEDGSKPTKKKFESKEERLARQNKPLEKPDASTERISNDQSKPEKKRNLKSNSESSLKNNMSDKSEISIEKIIKEDILHGKKNFQTKEERIAYKKERRMAMKNIASEKRETSTESKVKSKHDKKRDSHSKEKCVSNKNQTSEKRVMSTESKDNLKPNKIKIKKDNIGTKNKSHEKHHVSMEESTNIKSKNDKKRNSHSKEERISNTNSMSDKPETSTERSKHESKSGKNRINFDKKPVENDDYFKSKQYKNDDYNDNSRSQESPKPPKENSIFVRNINLASSYHKIRQFFEIYGEVESMYLNKNRETQAFKGSAFIYFKSKSVKDKILKLYNEYILNSKYSVSKAEYKFNKRFNNFNLKETTETKDTFSLDGNQLFVLDTLEKNQISNQQTKHQFEENLFTFKNFDRNLIKLGIIEGPYIDFAQYSAEEVKARRQSLEDKYKTLKNEEKYTLSKTRVVIKNLPKSINSILLKHVINKKLTKMFEDMKNTKFIKNIGVAAGKAENKKVESKGYAFVEFVNHEYALACIKNLSGRQSKQVFKTISSSSKILQAELAIEKVLALHKKEKLKKIQIQKSNEINLERKINNKEKLKEEKAKLKEKDGNNEENEENKEETSKKETKLARGARQRQRKKELREQLDAGTITEDEYIKKLSNKLDLRDLKDIQMNDRVKTNVFKQDQKDVTKINNIRNKIDEDNSDDNSSEGEDVIETDQHGNLMTD